MLLKVLRAKIHRATVTEAQIDYVGSITIDPVLIEAAGLVAHECVLVADLTNGSRFETYVIEGERDSGQICVNGAAARLVTVGDQVIIMAYGLCQVQEARELRPAIILVDEKNRISRRL